MLHFPSVRNAVKVSINRAGVHTCATDTARTVICGRTVDKTKEQIGVCITSIVEIVRPVAAFLTVGHTVTVSISTKDGFFALMLARHYSIDTWVRWEELVEPTHRVAGVVLVNGIAHLISIARISTCVFKSIAKAVTIVIGSIRLAHAIFGARRDGRRVRATAHIKLPAVRNAIAIRISTMGGHRSAVAASLLERLLKLLGNLLCRRLLGLTLLFTFTFFFTFAFTLLFTFRLILNLRIHNIWIGGLGPDDIPFIAVVFAIVIVVINFKVSAVLHHEVLVVRVVRTRVDGGTSGVIRLKSRVDRGVPAISHIAVHAAPRSTRIESEDLTHLIVNEDTVVA